MMRQILRHLRYLLSSWSKFLLLCPIKENSSIVRQAISSFINCYFIKRLILYIFWRNQKVSKLFFTSINFANYRPNFFLRVYNFAYCPFKNFQRHLLSRKCRKFLLAKVCTPKVIIVIESISEFG